MAILVYQEEKTHIFTLIMNMNISLDIIPTTFKSLLNILHIHWEGSVFQNFDIGLTCYFIICRKLWFEYLQKVARFLSWYKN